MIVNHKLLAKYSEYEFKIPYKAMDKVLVWKGDKVTPGREIIERDRNSKIYSFYVPDHIMVSQSEVQKYITRIDGELVKEGDILAEKTKVGGLTMVKLVSPAEGVVDLSRIESGYLDILGEEGRVKVKSTFSADVVDVNPVDGLVVKSQAYAMDIKIISKIYQKNLVRKLFGEFVMIGDGKELLLKAEGDDYTDKIVFVGKYLHTSLLQDLFEKGASFVLSYSMEYSDFRRQGLPVGLLGGFGEIYCGKAILSALSEKSGNLCLVDLDESQIFFFAKEKFTKPSKDSQFVLSAIGSLVRSLSLSNYSMIGRVVGIEENSSYITIEWENGSKGIMDIGSVEFISL